LGRELGRRGGREAGGHQVSDEKLKATLELVREGDADVFKNAARDLQSLGAEGETAAGKLLHANAALQNVDEGGLARAAAGAAKLKVAIDEYAAALDKAKAAGQNVSGDQLQALERLNSAYDHAVAKAAAYRASQEQTGRAVASSKAATDLSAGSIQNLGDVAALASPKLATLAGPIAAIIGTAIAAYKAGGQLKDMLDKLGFSKDIEALFSSWIEGADHAARETANLGLSTQELTNIEHVLRTSGIDPTNLSIRQQVDAYNKLVGAKQAAAQGADKLIAKINEERLALEQQANSLVVAVKAFESATPDASKIQIARIFKDQFQAVLDGAQKLGISVPQEFQKIADSLGIVSTQTQQHFQRIEQAAEAFYQKITGSATVTRQQLEEEAKGITLALTKIDFNALDTKKLDEAKAKVQQLVDSFRGAGEKIPEDLAAAADKLGVLVSALERSGEGFTSFAAGSHQAAGSTVEVTERIDAAGRKIVEVTDAAKQAAQGFGSVADKAEKAGASVQSVSDAAQSAGTAMGGVSEASAGVAKSTGEAASAGDEFGKMFRAMTGLVTSGAQALTAFNTALELLAQKAASSFDPLLAKLQEVNTALVALAQQAAATAQAVQNVVNAGGEGDAGGGGVGASAGVGGEGG